MSINSVHHRSGDGKGGNGGEETGGSLFHIIDAHWWWDIRALWWSELNAAQITFLGLATALIGFAFLGGLTRHWWLFLSFFFFSSICRLGGDGDDGEECSEGERFHLKLNYKIEELHPLNKI